jgi:hypothetical protein
MASTLGSALDGGAAASPGGPRVTVGAVLVGIAAIHQAVGLALGTGLAPGPFASSGEAPLVRMWRAGLFDSVGEDPEASRGTGPGRGVGRSAPQADAAS